MQIFPFFRNLIVTILLFSEIVIFYDYLVIDVCTPNWTPLSPITITYLQT